ncbi:hypothetical protein P167DRAFT_536582, partial [Morchella conica CCBAS932]
MANRSFPFLPRLPVTWHHSFRLALRFATIQRASAYDARLGLLAVCVIPISSPATTPPMLGEIVRPPPPTLTPVAL